MTNGAALQPGQGRVAAQRQRQAGQPLTDPGAAARLAEHAPPVQRVLGRRPTSTGRRAGRPRPPGAAASRTGRRGRSILPLGPVQPLPQAGVQRGHVDVGEVAGAAARPGRAGQVGRLRVHVDLAGRLVVAQPQPGRGAQEGAGQRVLGEPVQLAPAAPARRSNALAQIRREAAEHPDLGARHRVVPGWPAGPSLFRTPRRPAPAAARRPRPGSRRAAACSAARDHVLDLVVAHAGPGHHARRACPSARRLIAITVSWREREHAVRGQRVAGPAQVRGGGLVGDHDAAVGPGRGQRPLDGLLRGCARVMPPPPRC